MPRQSSLDTLRKHNLNIRQPVQGYRFSLDALLLADFARVPASAEVADLGTGCGIIPLLLARTHLDAHVVAFENNPDMATLAGENVRSNALDGRVEIVSDDILNIRSRYPVSTFDLVIANPPFRTAASGKVSPHRGRDAARHETTAGLPDFLATAKYLVKPGGRICFIYHPSRLTEFIRCAAEMKLALLRLRMVHGAARSGAKMFLAELAKARRDDLSVEAPLIVFGDSGDYTAEVAQIMGV